MPIFLAILKCIRFAVKYFRQSSFKCSFECLFFFLPFRIVSERVRWFWGRASRDAASFSFLRSTSVRPTVRDPSTLPTPITPTSVASREASGPHAPPKELNDDDDHRIAEEASLCQHHDFRVSAEEGKGASLRLDPSSQQTLWDPQTRTIGRLDR